MLPHIVDYWACACGFKNSISASDRSQAKNLITALAIPTSTIL